MSIKSILAILFSTLILAACGGGSDTTSGGAGSPNLSNKCSISDLSLSSGTQATLTKSNGSLTTTMNIAMQESLMVDISTN
ncbi:MAG: hypothetical protein ACR2QW_17110, partial [bacterium]